MHFIQYSPLTNEVRRVPLLIVPPWINKFYVLDLRPRNSLIRWVVKQGHTVFVISWVNPGARLAGKNFEDYMLAGSYSRARRRRNGDRRAGGQSRRLLPGRVAARGDVAYLADKGDTRAVSASYLATLVDFTDVGDMAVFIDEEQLRRA